MKSPLAGSLKKAFSVLLALRPAFRFRGGGRPPADPLLDLCFRGLQRLRRLGLVPREGWKRIPFRAL